MQQLDPETRKRLENGTLSKEEMKTLGFEVEEYDDEFAGDEYGDEDGELD